MLPESFVASLLLFLAIEFISMLIMNYTALVIVLYLGVCYSCVTMGGAKTTGWQDCMCIISAAVLIVLIRFSLAKPMVILVTVVVQFSLADVYWVLDYGFYAVILTLCITYAAKVKKTLLVADSILYTSEIFGLLTAIWTIDHKFDIMTSVVVGTCFSYIITKFTRDSKQGYWNENVCILLASIMLEYSDTCVIILLPFLLFVAHGLVGQELQMVYVSLQSIYYNANKQCILMDASIEGNIEMVKVSLNYGAKVNRPSHFGETALVLASASGHLEIVEFLLDHGAMVNVQTWNNDTALTLASSEGHNEIVELLLEHGGQLTQHNTHGESPLVMAIMSGHTETVRLLVEHGAQVNVSESDVFSPLAAASAGGHTEIVSLLLERGAEVNYVTLQWESALGYACRSGNYEVVKILLDNGADVNLENSAGITPLLIVCTAETAILKQMKENLISDLEPAYRGLHDINSDHIDMIPNHTEMLQLLLDNGAEVNGPNGTKALWVACFFGHNETVRQLLAHGANVNVCLYNYTALCCAVMARHLESLKLLLDNGAQVNGKTLIMSIITATKGTYLHILDQCDQFLQIVMNCLLNIGKEGHSDILNLLLEANGCTANVTTEEICFALVVASLIGHAETVEILLNHGAEVNNIMRDYGGATALIGASSEGNFEVVNHLLNHGADVNLLDNAGNSALITTVIRMCQFSESRWSRVRRGYEDYLKTTVILLNYGAKVDAKNNRKISAQIIASYYGNIQVLQLLLDYRCQVDPRAVVIARAKQHTEVVELLLRHSPDRYHTPRDIDLIKTHIEQELKREFGSEMQKMQEEILATVTSQVTAFMRTISSTTLSDSTTSTQPRPLKTSTVLKVLYPLAAEWKCIGTLLDIPDGKLDEINHDNHHIARECLIEMIKVWLKMVEPRPSWEQLADAIETINPRLASDIRTKYCSP